MTAMTVTLKEYQDNGNSKTFARTGHTASLPRLLTQRRKEASSATGSAELSIRVYNGTVDADNQILSARVSAEIAFKYPVNGSATDIASVLTDLRDIVRSAEYEAAITSLNWLPEGATP